MLQIQTCHRQCDKTQKRCNFHAELTKAKRYALIMLITYCFSDAKMGTKMRHTVTLYAHCVSCNSFLCCSLWPWPDFTQPARTDVLTSALLNTQVFRHVQLRRWVYNSQCFKGTTILQNVVNHLPNNKAKHPRTPIFII